MFETGSGDWTDYPSAAKPFAGRRDHPTASVPLRCHLWNNGTVLGLVGLERARGHALQNGRDHLPLRGQVHSYGVPPEERGDLMPVSPSRPLAGLPQLRWRLLRCDGAGCSSWRAWWGGARGYHFSKRLAVRPAPAPASDLSLTLSLGGTHKSSLWRSWVMLMHGF